MNASSSRNVLRNVVWTIGKASLGPIFNGRYAMAPVTLTTVTMAMVIRDTVTFKVF